MKRIGKYNGIQLYEDPNAPAGMVYFLKQDYVVFASLLSLTRWQRLRMGIKRWINRLF